MPAFRYREVDASKLVYELLKSKGFPDNAINPEPVLVADKKPSRSYMPDFVLVDPTSNDRVAIIEVKVINDESEGAIDKVICNAFIMLISMLSELKLESYVVIVSAMGVVHKIFAIDESGSKKEIPIELFNYDTVVVARRWKLREKYVTEKKESLDNFAILCWWASGGSFFVAVADFLCSIWNIVLIGPNRMVLIGIGIVLPLIPYFQRFRGLGIEFKRMSKKSHKRNVDNDANRTNGGK
jgi:hypothetical protein